jgi:hypothetical protein
MGMGEHGMLGTLTLRSWISITIACLVALTPRIGVACEEEYASTFELIQKAIFERHGCTTAYCHDAVASGGLNLLEGAAAYDALVDAPVQSFAARAPLVRVYPAKKENSLLWLNLAAATLPDQWTAPLRAMPLGGLPPLSLDELEVIQRWIEAGAPRNGVVEGTGEILDACLPPPEPLEIKPLDPPPAGTGLQLRAPRQLLPPKSEREVCFITYYDVTDQVPERFRGENGTFRYKRIDARQDPQSHHAVVIPYLGATQLSDPIWGPFTCGGGARDGQSCDPHDLTTCGSDGVCGSQPKGAVGCIGYGPGDASIGVGNDSLFNTMAAGLGGVDGIYAEAPLKGMLVWNSHAFNTTEQPAKLDIWVNLEFAAPEDQRHELQRFTEIVVQFGLDVPPFLTREMCSHYEVPGRAHLLELSSHNHKRGKRFQIWEGRFACAGGAGNGKPCSPDGPDPGLPHPDPCAGAPCIAIEPPAAGDCNADLQVSVNELVTGVGIALDTTDMSMCPRFDIDTDDRVSVDELVTGVHALLHPSLRDPDDSLLYTSVSYADPAVARFDPPRMIAPVVSSAVERTLTYCSLYDNGFTDPSEVKRRSTSPATTGGFPGGPCAVPTGCTAGRVGEACGSGSEAERDASCDTASGAGDGECDACTVRFGTTTEDEMFILLGAFYSD